MTIWLSIPDHPGYEAGDDGTLRSLRRGAPRVLRPYRTPSGHLQTMLGRGRHMLVHVGVCLAFHGPKPSPRHEVLHRNGIPDDNVPSNVFWGTRGQNITMDKHHGVIRQKLTVEAVRDIKMNARPFCNYDEFMAKYGVNRATISSIVTGRKHRDVIL